MWMIAKRVEIDVRSSPTEALYDTRSLCLGGHRFNRTGTTGMYGLHASKPRCSGCDALAARATYALEISVR